MIKAVLFDYGGVLSVEGKPKHTSRLLRDFFGIDIGWEKIDDLHDGLRRGNISTDDFFAELARRHNSTKQISAKEWNEISKDVFERSEPVYALAKRLRQHGIKTGVFSNVYEMTANVLRQIGNYEGFDPLILSYEIHLAKPDEEIYQVAIDKLGVGPAEVIFVDDQSKNLPIAEQLGMTTILAETPEQIVAEIRRIIAEENGIKL